MLAFFGSGTGSRFGPICHVKLMDSPWVNCVTRPQSQRKPSGPISVHSPPVRASILISLSVSRDQVYSLGHQSFSSSTKQSKAFFAFNPILTCLRTLSPLRLDLFFDGFFIFIGSGTVYFRGPFFPGLPFPCRSKFKKPFSGFPCAPPMAITGKTAERGPFPLRFSGSS